MKLSGLLRVFSSSLGVSDGTDVLLEDAAGVGIATIDTGTGAWPAGYWEHSENLNPYGQVDWSASVAGGGGVTQTRRESSLALPVYGGVSLAELVTAFAGLGDGVVSGWGDGLSVAPTGTRSVQVGTGAAVVRGYPCVVYSAATVAGTANATGGTRIDTLVLEVTPQGNANEGKSELKIVAGTTAAPALTQTASLWQFPLANLSLANGGTSYAVALDRRAFLLAALAAREACVDAVARTSSGGALGASPASVLATTATLAAGVTYDVVAEGTLTARAVDGAYAVALYLEIGGDFGGQVWHGQPAHATLVNAHARTVLGAGAAVTVRAYAYGNPTGGEWTNATLVVRATPRS